VERSIQADLHTAEGEAMSPMTPEDFAKDLDVAGHLRKIAQLNDQIKAVEDNLSIHVVLVRPGSLPNINVNVSPEHRDAILQMLRETLAPELKTQKEALDTALDSLTTTEQK